jgi:hypothetical protein
MNFRRGDLRGVQTAGIFNVARHVRGLQMGIANVAGHNDYPVGIVNIIKDGEMVVGTGYNEIGSATVNFSSG